MVRDVRVKRLLTLSELLKAVRFDRISLGCVEGGHDEVVQVTVEVRWAPSEREEPWLAVRRFAGPVVETFTHDRTVVLTDKLTLAEGSQVEVVDVSTVLVKGLIMQSLLVAPL